MATMTAVAAVAASEAGVESTMHVRATAEAAAIGTTGSDETGFSLTVLKKPC